MKNFLVNISNFFYVTVVLMIVLTIFSIPKCRAQTRFFTSEDFQSKMRGWNLGSVLKIEDIKVKDIPAAKATGANHGRIWLHMKRASNNSYYYTDFWGKYNLGNTPMLVMDSIIRMAEKIKFPLVFTIEFLPKQGADDWWGNRARKDSIIAVWVRMAKKYKDKKIIAAYDLMNEPRNNNVSGDGIPVGTVAEYVQFQYEIIKAIRAVDSNHVIVVEVLRNQMLGDLTRADSTVFKKTLLTLKNIVYSPHGYSKTAVTHQGSSTTVPMKYPDPNGKYTYSYNFLTNTYWQDPVRFQKKYNVPIWVGEFGCLNWAPKNNLGEWTSTRWTKDAIAWMESNGWSYAGQEWNGYQGWNPLFPSAWYYANAVFSSAKPSKLPTTSAKDYNSPTMQVYKAAFTKNQPIP